MLPMLAPLARERTARLPHAHCVPTPPAGLQSGQVQALFMPRTFTDYVASFDCSLMVAEREAFAAFWGAGVVTLADAPLVSLSSPAALPRPSL